MTLARCSATVLPRIMQGHSAVLAAEASRHLYLLPLATMRGSGLSIVNSESVLTTTDVKTTAAASIATIEAVQRPIELTSVLRVPLPTLGMPSNTVRLAHTGRGDAARALMRGTTTSPVPDPHSLVATPQASHTGRTRDFDATAATEADWARPVAPFPLNDAVARSSVVVPSA